MKNLFCMTFVVTVAAATALAGVADFDGDGRTDLSVFRPSDGNWYLMRSTQGFTGFPWGISTDTTVPGDFDGDGRPDAPIFRPMTDGGTPDFYVLSSSNSTVIYASWGIPGDTPVVADYDGDLRADFAVWRQSNNRWYVSRSSDGGFQSFANASNGRPCPGDFDGDGRTDFCNYMGGEWWIARSSLNYQITVIPAGGGGQDRPVAADYDGDHRTDAAVYFFNTGTWFIRYSSTGQGATVRWGISTDIPVPGDYDGDGLADVAIYRDGTWWLMQTRDGIAARQFGVSGDVPIPNRYLP
jgi:hypothetical protein